MPAASGAYSPTPLPRVPTPPLRPLPGEAEEEEGGAALLGWVWCHPGLLAGDLTSKVSEGPRLVEASASQDLRGGGSSRVGFPPPPPSGELELLVFSPFPPASPRGVSQVLGDADASSSGRWGRRAYKLLFTLCVYPGASAPSYSPSPCRGAVLAASAPYPLGGDHTVPDGQAGEAAQASLSVPSLSCPGLPPCPQAVDGAGVRAAAPTPGYSWDEHPRDLGSASALGTP